jgi:DNA polymerase/3'-5' exonuclease PolX
LANQTYYMELAGEPKHRVWAYRKAAWAIEDTPQDVSLIYRSLGRKGLESIENVGPSMAQVVEALLSPRR